MNISPLLKPLFSTISESRGWEIRWLRVYLADSTFAYRLRSSQYKALFPVHGHPLWIVYNDIVVKEPGQEATNQLILEESMLQVSMSV